jgi:hypothetical protein
MDFIQYIVKQREWSERTFGRGPRTNGITRHIEEELAEIRAAPHDLSEWIDVVILALDGGGRAGYTPEEIVAELERKQAVNFAREWPPAKDVDPDQPSEHVRADTSEEEAAVRRPPMEAFEKELTQLINRYSIENMVDMPDFLLAGMICRMIEAMGPSIKSTLDWHGCDSVCHPAPIVGGEECDPDEESPPAPCNGQCSQNKCSAANQGTSP